MRTKINQIHIIHWQHIPGNTAMMVGNLLYSVPLSPWCLVGGKAVAGIAIPLRSVMAGILFLFFIALSIIYERGFHAFFCFHTFTH